MSARHKKSNPRNSLFFDMPVRDEVAVRAACALEAEIRAKDPYRRIDDFMRRLERLESRVQDLEAANWF